MFRDTEDEEDDEDDVCSQLFFLSSSDPNPHNTRHVHPAHCACAVLGALSLEEGTWSQLQVKSSCRRGEFKNT